MGHQLHRYQWQELTITDAVIDCVVIMATEEEAQEIIDGYPNVQFIPVNPITDGYKNEDDDEYEYEYEHSEGLQKDISLEDEVEIHEPIQD